jgi:type VI secretion system protein ImpH
MAPPDLRRPVDLTACLRAEPHRFRFVQAVRLLALAEGSPLPRRVRFRTPASLAFPASEILGLAGSGGALELLVGFLSLTGPCGVLPAHYTELLMERRDLHRDGTAHAFLDLFSHRALALFYGAWRKYRFPLALEQGEEGGLPAWLLAVAGMGTGAADKTLEPIIAGHAGALARRPLPAAALQALVASCCGARTVLEPFQGQWLPVPSEARARLGAGLGDAPCLGPRLWDRQTRIGLRIGPLAPAAFQDLLPGRPGGAALAALVRACLGRALGCDLVLVLAAGAAPRPRLGGAAPGPRLGIDLWLARGPLERDTDDTRFRLVA